MNGTTATANPLLNAVLRNFFQNQKSFVGSLIAPAFPSAVQSSKYFVFDAENEFSVPGNIERAAGTTYKRTKMVTSEDSFECTNKGIEIPVDDEERIKYENQFSMDAAAVRRAGLTVMVDQEVRVHGLATSGVVSSSVPAIRWDAANSTPMDDIDMVREIIFDTCGMEMTSLTMSRNVFNVLKRHPQIIDLYKHTHAGQLTREILAEVFEVNSINIAGGLINVAADGQTLAPSKIWGNSVIASVTQNTPDLEAPNFMRTFNWSRTTAPGGTSVMSYRQEDIESMVHRAKQHTDEKLTGLSLGYHLETVLT